MKTNNQEIIYAKDSFPDYLSQKDRVAASDLKNFMCSPATYYYERFLKKEKADERHFAVGSALHEAILEPHEFKNHYIISPKFDMRTKAGKEGAIEFAKTSEGKTIITEDEMEMICKMAENSIKNETFVELIKDSQREISCYTTDEKTGLKLRMRPDSLKGNIVTDIKSCLDSSPRKFKNDVYNYGYSLSAAYYCDFLNCEKYIFAAMEKQEPHQISLFQLSEEMIEYGRKQYRTGLDLLHFCQTHNHWPNYNDFEILKTSYELEDLKNYFDTLEKSEKIYILR